MNEIKIRGRKSGYCKGEGGEKKTNKWQLEVQIDRWIARLLDRHLRQADKQIDEERKDEDEKERMKDRGVTGDGGFKRVIIYK